MLGKQSSILAGGPGLLVLALSLAACGAIGAPAPLLPPQAAAKPLPFYGPGAAVHATVGSSGMHLAGSPQLAFLETGLGIGGRPSILGNGLVQPSADDPIAYGYYPGGYLPFVTSAYNGTSLYLANLAGGTVYQVPGLPPTAIEPVLSGGGRFVTYLDHGELQSYDLATQLIATYPQFSKAVDVSAGLSTDAFGDLTYVDAQGEVHVFSRATGQDYIVPAASRGLHDLHGLTLSGDGRYLGYGATVPGGSSLYLTDLYGGAQYTVPFTTGFAEVNPLDFRFSSTGDQVLYSQSGQARLLDLRTGFTDNLALLNNGVPVTDAAFLDASNTNIAFTRYGQLQVYNRATGLIDTLPILNGALSGLGMVDRSHFNYGSIR